MRDHAQPPRSNPARKSTGGGVGHVDMAVTRSGKKCCKKGQFKPGGISRKRWEVAKRKNLICKRG
jgi:hypothetical protein